MDEEHQSDSDELQTPVESVAAAGVRLREAREAAERSLQDIAAETRIPIRHLETIENGEFDELPSRAYAIGFARTYARAVGLDESEITGAVRAELAEGGGRRSAMGNGMEPGDAAKVPSSGLALAGGFAALVLAVGVITFYSTYYAAGDGPESLIAEVEEQEPAAGAEPLAEIQLADADENGEAAGAQAPAAEAGAVVFTALEDGVWVRFYEADGDRLFEAQMDTGDRFELPSDAAEPRINTGRPDAFAITIGGRTVPKLAEEPITMGDTPISAAALLARVETPGSAQTATN